MPPASNPMAAARKEIITRRNGAVASGCSSAAVLIPVTENWALASGGGVAVTRVEGELLSCTEIYLVPLFEVRDFLLSCNTRRSASISAGPRVDNSAR